jgi:outer membrane protein assembly factor BamB
VGGAGVIAPSNDSFLYAMQRGALAPGGEWPASFVPIDVGVVQARSPVIPIDVSGTNPVIYVGSQDGAVYAIDAAQGGSVPYLWTALLPPLVLAAPAGIFTDLLGAFNYVLIGTRDGALSAPNAFVALHPVSGVEIDRQTNGGAGPGAIGPVHAMAAVDYGPPARVYFTSNVRSGIGSPNTLWCYELAAAAPVFSPCWPARALGSIDASPTLRGGRVYVGNTAGTVYSIDAATGGDDIPYAHGDGALKGFVFPDRASNDIYFATDNLVWGLTDTGAALTLKFSVALPNTARPSAALFVPGDHYLYVGGSDGRLYELDTLQAPPVPKPVTLGNGAAAVGAPSLDRVHDLVHVGTEAGIFYAVQVPLP